MEQNVMVERFREALLGVLDETFEHVHGYFLDKNTSLLETLDTISAAEASFPVSESGASIAGHVYHTRFYLALMIDMARGTEVGKIDWDDSWVVKHVTDEEWSALKTSLRTTYEEILVVAKSESAWEAEGRMWGAMAMVAHNAYHLGAIRMALAAIRR
jgi:hypothetical protein